MKDGESMGLWNLVPQFQRGTEARQCVSRLESLPRGLGRPVCTAVKEKPKENLGCWAMGCLLGKAACEEWTSPRGELYVAQITELRWRELPKCFGMQMIPPRAIDTELQIWRFLYKVSVLLWSNNSLICSYSSFLEWKCFIFGGIVYWRHITCFSFYRSLRRHSALIPFEQCSGTAKKKTYEALWCWTKFILHNEMTRNLFGGRLCLKSDMLDVSS